MSDNLKALAAAGVSIWLDDLSRGAITSGLLAKEISEKSVVGVTTNPTIFANALSKGADYSAQMKQLAAAGTSLDDAVVEATTEDVRNACDLFADTYARTGQDGRVSIEVDPRLAHEPEETIVQARMLWAKVNRPNVMVKIPATRACLPAITTAISEGMSINVTLIFSLERYKAVAEAYIAGLEQAHAAGIDLSKIHSVASFFISRIDSEVDGRLERLGSPAALELRGKVAIANGQLAYEAYEEIFGSERFRKLPGANKQRVLWASTGVKNPNYPDTLYVSELVAPNVVNTMPTQTLQACADHLPAPHDTVTGSYESARATMAALADLGISFDEVTKQLEDEGIVKFEQSWEELLESVRNSLKG